MLFNSFEAFAMNGAEAVSFNGFAMGLGRVAFVAVKPELGIIIMIALHDPIAGLFGND